MQREFTQEMFPSLYVMSKTSFNYPRTVAVWILYQTRNMPYKSLTKESEGLWAKKEL